jgi:hypothetical protein
LSISEAESEFLKALELVREYDKQRPVLIKEYRLYYNEDGSIIGLWESGHPEGDNYIVINDPDVFHRTVTSLLRVVNKELKVIDPHTPNRVKLRKSNTGQAVVRGNAALVVMVDEIYSDTEYYDRTNN